jgi:hypothetical protein
MDNNQTGRITRAREVLNDDRRGEPAPTTGHLLHQQAERIGKLEYWLRDIIALADELDAAPPPPAALVGYGYTLPEDYLRGGAQ